MTDIRMRSLLRTLSSLLGSICVQQHNATATSDSAHEMVSSDWTDQRFLCLPPPFQVLFVYESALGAVNLYRFDQSNLVKRAVLTLPTAIFDTAGRLAIGQGLPPEDGQYYASITSYKGEVDNLRWAVQFSEIGMLRKEHQYMKIHNTDEWNEKTLYIM